MTRHCHCQSPPVTIGIAMSTELVNTTQKLRNWAEALVQDYPVAWFPRGPIYQVQAGDLFVNDSLHNWLHWFTISVIRQAKINYFNSEIQTAKHDMKKTWAILKEATNTQQTKSPLPDHYVIENKKVTDKKKIVDTFNKFFANIGYNISKNVPQPTTSFHNYLNQPHYNSMFLDPITPNDIIETVSKFKNKNSHGHDEISTKLVKESIIPISNPLAHIINQSMTNGIVPINMKLAKVVPIFKSGDKHQFNNYRPISILPASSKILEKIVAKKLIKYLESEHLLYKHQYGFRPNHSTIHPIIHLLNDITKENDKQTKNLTLSVFIDLSKAFDTINHDILLKKLEYLGIRGVANQWFKDYLTDRKQYMKLDENISSCQSLKCAVPQGSILGPILFLIYVNDICNCSSLNILSFADDTTVTVSSSNINDMFLTMNSELEKLTNWLNANRLCLNVKKTKYILFRPRNYTTNISQNRIYLNGEEVDQISNINNETSFKFLGLHVDESLTWKYHVKKVCARIARSNYILNKVKNFLPYSTLNTLYAAIVQSHINYGLIIWGNSTSINQLIKLQKKSIRIINNKPYN